MPRPPSRLAALVLAFAPVSLRHRTRRRAEPPLIGAIAAPGGRTATSPSRAVGLGRERRSTNCRRLLNRAARDARAAARLLLGLPIAAFVPAGPVVLGVDDAIGRRRGRRVGARGVHRDPVRSSKGHLVEAGGLRWLSLTLPAPVPWAGRAWAGRAWAGRAWAGRAWAPPFPTALAPSGRHRRERGARHKGLTDWARQAALRARRWLPGREVVPLGGSGFAALDLPAALARHGPVRAARPRLDAALHEPAPPREPGAVGRPRTEGARLPDPSAALADAGTRWDEVTAPGRRGGRGRVAGVRPAAAVRRRAGPPAVPIRRVPPRDPRHRFDPRAPLRAGPARDAPRTVGRLVRRWQAGVAFRGARDHPGVETRRRWSDRAVARATPRPLGPSSVAALLAARLDRRARSAARTDARHRKPRPTSADALAAVRRQLWREQGPLTSWRRPEATRLRPALRHGIARALRHAA